MAKRRAIRHKWSGSLGYATLLPDPDSWENEIHCLKCGLRQKVGPRRESAKSPYGFTEDLLWTSKAEPGWHATKVPACIGKPA